jgi:hypothetical protein
MAPSFGETVGEIWAYLNKPVFENSSQMTAADLEASYREGVLLDGLTRVRVRYEDDGRLALHPEDQKRYEEAMGNYRKEFAASAFMQRGSSGLAVRG